MELDPKDVAVLKVDHTAGPAIEAKAETVAKGKTTMSVSRTFMLGILAGMFIATGALFMTYVKSDSSLGFAAASVGGAACFSIGLVCVIVAGAELFTGNTLMVCAALSKEISWKDVLKNWGIVYVANLIGSLLIVAVIFFANSAGFNGGHVGETMITVANSKIGLTPQIIFFRGIMCNFLVCLAVWMGFAGKTVADKIVTTMFPVIAFVGMGFEHCVANMFFLPMGCVALATGAGAGLDPTVLAAAAQNLTAMGCVYNIFFATLGNLVGGAGFVGLFYWLAYKK